MKHHGEGRERERSGGDRSCCPKPCLEFMQEKGVVGVGGHARHTRLHNSGEKICSHMSGNSAEYARCALCATGTSVRLSTPLVSLAYGMVEDIGGKRRVREYARPTHSRSSRHNVRAAVINGKRSPPSFLLSLLSRVRAGACVCVYNARGSRKVEVVANSGNVVKAGAGARRNVTE